MALEADVAASGRGGRTRRGVTLSLEDCRCPVCLEIFMEPVTLPCTHTFCKGCFLESVDKATLCCPLCRLRVSSWARRNSRGNTLVNQQLWTQIQNCFPQQCQRRLSGLDGSSDDGPAGGVFVPRVSEPGELRQEYEDQVTKLTEEKRAFDEEERKASEELIQKLLQEEEQQLQEEMKRRETDEKLARLLSNQLNAVPVGQDGARPADVTPTRKRREVSAGQIERFLSPLPSKRSLPDCIFTANKDNVLVSLQVELGSETPDLRPSRLAPPLEEHHQLSSNGGPSSAKRKCSETPKEEEVTPNKRACLPSSSDVTPSVLQLGAECRVEQLSRRRQEEEDLRLALLLQKELNEEERKAATDRRKGTMDAYPLRQTLRGKKEAGSSAPPRKTSTLSSAPRTSTLSSSWTSTLSSPRTSTLSSPRTSTLSSAPRTSTLSSAPRTSTLSSAPRTSTPSSSPRTSTPSSSPRTSTPSSAPRTSTSSSAPRTSTSSSAPRTSTSSSAPRTSTSSSAPRTSTLSSSPSGRRGSKQATLTEMFSSQSS